MQNLYLYDCNNILVKEGTKEELKNFVTTNKLKGHSFRSKLIEKVMNNTGTSREPVYNTIPTLPVNVVTQADQKQSFFNRVFRR